RRVPAIPRDPRATQPRFPDGEGLSGGGVGQGQPVDEHQPARRALRRLLDDAGDAVQGQRRPARPRPGLEPRAQQAARPGLSRLARRMARGLVARALDRDRPEVRVRRRRQRVALDRAGIVEHHRLPLEVDRALERELVPLDADVADRARHRRRGLAVGPGLRRVDHLDRVAVATLGDRQRRLEGAEVGHRFGRPAADRRRGLRHRGRGQKRSGRECRGETDSPQHLFSPFGGRSACQAILIDPPGCDNAAIVAAHSRHLTGGGKACFGAGDKETPDMALRTDIDPDGLLEYSVVFTDRSLNHMSQAFQQVMREIHATLCEAYSAHRAVVVPGGGTYAMESVARQFATDRKVLVIRNGFFSYRWTQIFEAGDIPSGEIVMNAMRVGESPQAPFAPCRVELVVATIRSDRREVGFAPHVETASGIILPDAYVRAVADAAHEVGALFVRDCIASGAAWVDMREAGVDVLISAPQQGWSAPPSAGLVMLTEDALERCKAAQSTSFAMDLNKW